MQFEGSGQPDDSVVYVTIEEVRSEGPAYNDGLMKITRIAAP